MKKLIKKIPLALVILLALTISFGCTPKEPPTEPNIPENVIDKEDPVANEPNEESTDSFTISESEPIDFSDLTLLSSTTIDYDGDETNETISLYTVAGRGPDGEMAWDDGQNWILAIHDTDKEYILFNDYVQLGSISFYAYFEDEDFVISTIQSGTANLSLTEYRLDKASGDFIGTIKFAAEGNVNMFYQAPLNY